MKIAKSVDRNKWDKRRISFFSYFTISTTSNKANCERCTKNSYKAISVVIQSLIDFSRRLKSREIISTLLELIFFMDSGFPFLVSANLTPNRASCL